MVNSILPFSLAVLAGILSSKKIKTCAPFPERDLSTYIGILYSSHILSEISLRNEKIDELNKIEKLNIHKKVMKDISLSFEIKDLPKVGLTELNTKILRAMNSNDFKKNYKTSDIRELTEAYLNGLVMFEIEKILNRIISEENISEDKKDLMKEQIIAALIMDETIDYTLESGDGIKTLYAFIKDSTVEEGLQKVTEIEIVNKILNSIG